ncbi:hypothetical protein H310_09486 [Aphanomyces invadans]|uniref:Uncharacterized protein n=1 Tax=Aphanomyces invadans TaxID=157072 RepID=A0A024TTT9_9STRA|nr:hypothetical protein H310_09486 [Aphanomyces invadans]ETV97590.1 hypothetical protein H310_09486 [Aphanomyces invadans]|eukprot:XP_008873799.1 hypothetical protein H310_09486 [Aphanomyces invadans]
MPFAAFEHESWHAFFMALRGSFKIPSTEAIGGDLMRSEYALTMNDVLLALAKNTLICFTLDGATSVQGKQVINMMACEPKPFFLEHFTMELRRESAANLLEKLLNCKLCLLGSIRKPAPGFVLTTDEEDVENPMNDTNAEVEREEGRSCKTNEHFINPPMFCFCTDSPSVMVKLRKDCLNTKDLVFATFPA